MSESRSERLFSYGTLQQESVQLANFGRKLQGRAYVVMGWRLAAVRITDPKVLALSGLGVHKIMVPGEATDEVDGLVFEITPEELKAADSYETADYQRVKLTLRSGAAAWTYVGAQPAG